MTTVIVAHHVADYDNWYSIFTEHGEVRRQHGATGHTVLRSVTNPDEIVIVSTFEDEAGAKAFLADPELPDVMARAGVDSAPAIYLVEESEALRY